MIERLADAQTQPDLAFEVVRRLPDVWAALDAGRVDLPKARVICDAVLTLEEEPARAVVAGILPRADGLTTGQLRARLARLVLEAGVGQFSAGRGRPTRTRSPRGTARAGHRVAGCRHTVPWSVGGPTTTTNLGALCRHHHRMKDGGPWRLRQVREGVFAWHSPVGRGYLVAPEPP